MPSGIYPKEYQSNLKEYNPKSAEEAYKILLRLDYLNEITSIDIYARNNIEIAYSPKTPLERYPAFKRYNLKQSSLDIKLKKMVKALRKSIGQYNRIPEKREQYKNNIKREISDIIVIIDKI